LSDQKPAGQFNREAPNTTTANPLAIALSLTSFVKFPANAHFTNYIVEACQIRSRHYSPAESPVMCPMVK
jgi:hypothetical protein